MTEMVCDEYIQKRTTFIRDVEKMLSKARRTVEELSKLYQIKILFEYIAEHKSIWYQNPDFRRNSKLNEIVYNKLLEFREKDLLPLVNFNIDTYIYHLFNHHVCQGHTNVKKYDMDNVDDKNPFKRCRNRLVNVKPMQPLLCHIHIKNYKKTFTLLTKNCGLYLDLSRTVMKYVSY